MMDIEKEGAKLRKRIEKLNWQLTSGIALSDHHRTEKEEKIEELREKLKALEQMLTTFEGHQNHVKYH